MADHLDVFVFISRLLETHELSDTSGRCGDRANTTRAVGRVSKEVTTVARRSPEHGSSRGRGIWGDGDARVHSFALERTDNYYMIP